MGLLSLLESIHCDIHTLGCLDRYLMSPLIGEDHTETYPWGKDDARGPGETQDSQCCRPSLQAGLRNSSNEHSIASSIAFL